MRYLVAALAILSSKALAQAPAAAPLLSPASEAAPLPAPPADPDLTAPPVQQAPAAPLARVIQDSRPGMGTRMQVMVWSADEALARSAIDAAFAELVRLEELFSEWKPTSDVSRINRGAGKGPVSVSDETFALISRGKQLSMDTNGALALTWAALAGHWDFSKDGAKKVPDPARVAERLQYIDDSKITLDPLARTVAIPEGFTIGVGAIGEGYALERARAVLREKGFTDALVFIGGDIAVAGQKGEKPWLVGIQDPRGSGYFATLPVKDEVVTSSGDYEKFFEVDGVRYSHVLDPKTGMPAHGCRSVTVIGKDPTTADGLATAIMVMGPEAGMKLIETMPDYGVVIVDAQNQVSISSSVKSRVRIVRPPTS
jgi:FAD:protein FMN transferase